MEGHSNGIFFAHSTTSVQHLKLKDYLIVCTVELETLLSCNALDFIHENSQLESRLYKSYRMLWLLCISLQLDPVYYCDDQRKLTSSHPQKTHTTPQPTNVLESLFSFCFPLGPTPGRALKTHPFINLLNTMTFFFFNFGTEFFGKQEHTAGIQGATFQ